MKKLIAILILMAAPAAHAGNWSTMWTMQLDEVLDVYLQTEDKNVADNTINGFMDGFAHGFVATYNYQDEKGGALVACYNVSDMSASRMRIQMLSDARDPELGKVQVATYLYAMLHINCDVVLGDYASSDEETT